MLDRLIDLIVALWIHFQPIVFVMQYDEAVVMRGGKYLKNWKPGWHLRIPFVDDFHTDTVMFDTMTIKEVNITTIDGKTASIGGEYDIKIVDIYKALITTHSWRSNMVDVTQGILSDTLEDYSWEDLRKKTTKNAVEKKIQKRAEEMGLEVSNFNFTNKALSRVYKLFNT